MDILKYLRFLQSWKKSLGQWSSFRNFLSFLDVLIKQCSLLKITCSSPTPPVIGLNQDINLAWRLKMLKDWYVMQLLQGYLMTCLCKVETREKFWIHASNLVCGLGGGAGHVWLWRNPHKCKCDPRLLSMIVVTKCEILLLLTPRCKHTDRRAIITGWKNRFEMR